jgi:hypothetical protein
VACLTDGDGAVRKGAQEALTEIISTCGKKPLGSSLIAKLEKDEPKKWKAITVSLLHLFRHIIRKNIHCTRKSKALFTSSYTASSQCRGALTVSCTCHSH